MIMKIVKILFVIFVNSLHKLVDELIYIWSPCFTSINEYLNLNTKPKYFSFKFL